MVKLNSNVQVCRRRKYLPGTRVPVPGMMFFDSVPGVLEKLHWKSQRPCTGYWPERNKVSIFSRAAVFLHLSTSTATCNKHILRKS
jgi:hypothetical protein